MPEMNNNHDALQSQISTDQDSKFAFGCASVMGITVAVVQSISFPALFDRVAKGGVSRESRNDGVGMPKALSRDTDHTCKMKGGAGCR